jgi:hypothetical protein
LAQDIALFWAVLAGLLFFDNLVLVPSGGDYLKVARSGQFRYEPRPRFKAWRRDLVLLNPVNPFDRLVLTERAIGEVTVEQMRTGRDLIRGSMRGVTLLSWLGAIYLLVLATLAAGSLRYYFGTILAALAAVHVSCWTAGLAIMLIHRRNLRISKGQVAGLALEALLVPGYLVNLGKRVWFKQRLDIAALSIGLRQALRMSDYSTRELYCLRMARRLNEVAYELGLPTDSSDGGASGPSVADSPSASAASNSRQALHAWLLDAHKCLTTSAPPAGL